MRNSHYTLTSQKVKGSTDLRYRKLGGALEVQQASGSSPCGGHEVLSSGESGHTHQTVTSPQQLYRAVIG